MASLAINSNTTEGYFGENWRTGLIYEKPQIMQKFLQYYPEEQSLLLNYSRIAGNIINVSNDKMYVYYDGAMQRLVTTGADVAGSVAGANITITLSSDDFDNGNPATGLSYLRQDAIVLIPTQYTTLPNDISPKGFKVYSISGNSFVLRPLGLYGIASTGLPAGTHLIVAGTSYGRGQGQPNSLVDREYEDSFHTVIVKETMTADGGVAAIRLWRDELENGGGNTFLRGTAKTNFRMDAAIEYQLWLGQLNENSVTSQNVQSGSPTQIKGTKGIIPHLETDGMLLPYYNDAYALSDLESIKTMFESQMVTERRARAFVGPGYMRRFERAGVQYLKDNSTATDLTKNMEQIGYPLRTVYSNGLYIDFVEMGAWSNPVSYGAAGYPFQDLAVFMPNSQGAAKIKGGLTTEEVTLNNFTLGYLNNNGENRTRVFRAEDGMTGREVVAVNQYDRANFYLLSEFMVMLVHKNQMILSTNKGNIAPGA